MNRTINLDEVASRPMKRFHLDGLGELGVGLIMLAGSGFNLINRALPKGSPIAEVYLWAGMILVAGCYLAIPWGLKRIKATIVVPRTGYVALRPSKSSRVILWAALGCGALIAAASIIRTMVYAKSALPELSGMAGPGLAILFAACFLFAGLHYRWPHMLWLAAVSLLLGAWAYWIGAGSEGGLWVMLGLGAAMALSGGWLLRSFVKANPKAEDAQS
jgi:hypothetical protein